MINCNEIQQNINALLIAFADCNKIKNSDLTTLVELIQALNNCDNSGSLEQDNIDVVKYVKNYGLAELTDITQIVNSFPQYNISEVQSLWFKEYVYGVRIDGVKTVSPLIATNIYKVINKGQGMYGVGGIQLQSDDLLLVSSNVVNLQVIENDPLTQIYTISDLQGLTVSQYINGLVSSVTFQDVDIAPRLIKITEPNNIIDYLFLPPGGVYGQGQLQTTDSDFQILNREAVDSVNGQTGVVVLDAEDVGAIPITGTTVGNPITGDLEFQNGLRIKSNFEDIANCGVLFEDGRAVLYSNEIGTFLDCFITLSFEGVTISNNNPDSKGLIGIQDFTSNITDLDYTQKKYVDTKAPLTPRVQSVTSSATVTPTSTNDIVTITAQAVALTLANPTGTFAEGQALMIRIKDNGTAQAITFGSNYRAIGVTLPTTTIANKILYLGIIYDSIDAKWDVLGINLQA